MASVAEEAFKVIVVGDGNVGKTSMLRRFVRGDFVEQYRRTVGAEFLEKDVYVRTYAATVRLMLWDTAGQEMFNALTQAYYRGAGAAVIAFSTVDRASFEHVMTWKARVEHVCGPITMVLCQTKMDLAHDPDAVARHEGEQLAEQLHVPFFRVSTKDDFNVTQLFEFVAEQCMAALDNNNNNNNVHVMTNDARGVVAAAAATASPTAAVPASVHSTAPVAVVTAAPSALHHHHHNNSSSGGGGAVAPPAAAAATTTAASVTVPTDTAANTATAAAAQVPSAAASSMTTAVGATHMPTTLTLPVVLPTPVAVPAAAAAVPPSPPRAAAAPSSQRRVRLQDAKATTPKRKRKRRFKCSLL